MFPHMKGGSRIIILVFLVDNLEHLNSLNLNYRKIIVNTVQCDSICRYLVADVDLHVSVS
jgi:hypothetical protein